MKIERKNTAILLLSCNDAKGIVAEISNFIYKNNGNIIYSDQHTDVIYNMFFMRVEWELTNFNLSKDELFIKFTPIAEKYNMNWQIKFSHDKIRTAIFVSKQEHCLQDILIRHKQGELDMDIALIISNHVDAKYLADEFGIDFVCFPIENKSKAEQEKLELQLLADKNIDLIILARYMQVLSSGFIEKYKNRIINIHHSFLPAFSGGKPYEQAFSRGVKLIGATSHYATSDLDQGPIIDQDVMRITHRDSIEDIKIKGRDVEKIVLYRAVKLHLKHKIFVYKDKTIIFD